MPREIKIPYNFQSREYQYEFLSAPQKFKVAVWHRRAGKSKCVFNEQVRKTQLPHLAGKTFYYILPTYSQAKKVIWDELVRMHVPMEIVEKMNGSELSIYYKNGSIQRIVGCEDYKNLKGINPIDVVFDEFQLIDMRAYTEVIKPILSENGGTVTFIGTPEGRNQFWEILTFAKQNPDQWFHSIKTVDDTLGIPREEIDRDRTMMPEALFLQEYYCFPKGTDIITMNGVKDIAEINVGDYVLSHSNRYNKVLKTFKREYIGNLLKIKSFGNNKPLICTPNHPIRICNDGVNYKWVKAEDLKKTDRLVFPKILLGKNKLIDKNLVKLLAWFITEGNYYNQTVNFCLNENELEYQAEIISLLEEYTNKKIRTLNNNRGSTRIYVNDRELGEFFIKNCGSGAKNKVIPFELIKGYEEIFYDTLIKGDGCNINKIRDCYVTISKSLAYQVQLLANCIGYTSSISLSRPERIEFIEGREVNCNESYTVRISKNIPKKSKNGYKNDLKIIKHKYSVTASIIKIEEIDFNGLVYNFEVQNDNSYTANGREVHNCDFTEGAGAFFKRIRENTYEADDYPDSQHYYQLGIDLAKYKDFTVITPFDLYTFKAKKQDRFNQVDWNFQKMLIEAKARRYNNAKLKLDRTGVGDPIVEDLERMGLNVGEDGAVVFSKQSRRDLLDNLSILLQQDRIKIPNDPGLIEELESFQFVMNDKGKIEVKSRKGLNDDRVMSLALAVHGVDVPIKNRNDDYRNKDLDKQEDKNFDRFAVI